jgi:N-acetylmuramic acid 6-phosphate etherase
MMGASVGSGIEFGGMFRDSSLMPSENQRVLGIEGGGTKTEWVLLEGDTVVQQGLLPQSNLRLNTDEQLMQLFGVMPRDVSQVGAFLAACGTPDDRARLRGLIKASWPDAAIAVGSDRDSALATAFHDGDGIIIIAGTGAAVHGRRGGRIEKAGGWGHVVGDRGGGYDLARQAVRLVLTRFDLEQQMPALAERILQQLGLNSLSELGTWAMEADKMSVARLAPSVFEAVHRGEPEMLEVAQEGASVLADFANAVARRLQWEDPPVRLFGGLFTKHQDYASLFTHRLSVLLPRADVSVCRDSGAMGAAWLAARTVAKQTKEPEQTVNLGEIAVAATEQSNPRSENLDSLSTSDLVDLFVKEERYVEEAVRAERDALARAVDLISQSMTNGGRLYYAGAGTSGRLGVLDASEIPPTFGAPPELIQGIIAGGATALHRAIEGAEDQPEYGALAIAQRGVRKGDVVCGLTASGRTPFVLGTLARAREMGAHTILITCNPKRHPSAQPWDVEIDLPTGPELVTGSTRLKAGTATKVALNLLSTAAMVRMGRVRGNRMVDVGISNEKLRDRGTRIVAETLKIPYPDARQRLEKAQWNVRACLEAK